jgi:hypothetical protein
VALRRLTAGDIAGGRLTLSGSAETGTDPRITAFDLDFSGAEASRLAALVPGSQLLAAAAPVWQGGYAMRAAGRAAGERIDVTAVAELLDARLEAAGTADQGFSRGEGRLALQHPGAPRLLSAFGLPDVTPWLGEGSLAVVAEGTIDAGAVTLRQAELVAGRLRTRLSGEVGVTAAGGRFSLAAEAETLPLPAIAWGDTAPWNLAALAGWSGEAVLRVAALPVGDTAGLSRIEARLVVDQGTVRLPAMTATLRGGALSGSASLTPAGAFAAEWTLADAVLAEPLFGLPFDLAGGSIGIAASVTGTGLSPSALLTTLSGEARVTAGSGVLTGFDIPAAAEALTAPLPEAEALARVRRALGGGATAFERLSMQLRADRGIVAITEANLGAQSGTASATGEIDLRAAALGLSIAVIPVGGAEALPDLGLRVSGPVASPRRVIETAAAARHLAERARAPRR